MNEIIRKLSSRKLWLSLAGVATGIAIAMGADASEIETVTGSMTALLSAVAYIWAEGKVDVARVTNEAEQE